MFSPKSLAGYSFEIDGFGRTFIRSVHEGSGSERKVTFCLEVEQNNFTLSVDCSLDQLESIKYIEKYKNELSRFIKTTDASILESYYSLGKSKLCLRLIDDSVRFDVKMRTEECLTFYIPISRNFDAYSKDRIAVALASIAHENFHVLYNPFLRKGRFNKLLANEYAASLITLNAYRVLNKQLGISFDGKWSFELAEQFRKAEKLSEYCENFHLLRKRNKGLGDRFDSLLGSILAHIFINNLDIEASFIPFYIDHELNLLSKSSLEDSAILHRVNVCDVDIHTRNLREISLNLLDVPIEFDDKEKFSDKNNGAVIGAMISRNYSVKDVKNICNIALPKDLCVRMLLSNLIFLDSSDVDLMFEQASSVNQEYNISRHNQKKYVLDKYYRYRDINGQFVADTGASSNVWPKGSLECDLSGKKTVYNLFGRSLTLERCTYDSEIGVIWVIEHQADKVRSLHSLLMSYEAIFFERQQNIEQSTDSTEKHKLTVPFIYKNGLVTFQLDNNLINYCLDTGSPFSHFTLRLQERFLIYPNFHPNLVLEIKSLNGINHMFINLELENVNLMLKSNPVVGAEQCDIIMGADLLHKFSSVKLTDKTLTFTRSAY